jgi:ankyrin repeat protein
MKLSPILTPTIFRAVALSIYILSLHTVFSQPASDSLFDAVKGGDVGKVKALLDQKVDVNVRNSVGRTPLMIAVMSGKGEVVKLLLDQGADTSLQDSKGETAKQLGAEFGQTEIVTLLDKAVAVADPQVAFLNAVGNGDLQAAQAALVRGADVNVPTGRGATALMAAAVKGDHAMLKFLLEKGATLNAVDSEGRTAFDYADLPGHPTDEQAQQMLREKGAITEQYAAQLLNEKLRDAVRGGDLDKVEAALAKKADPNYIGKDGPQQTVLMIAAESGNVEMVKALLKAGANPNRKMQGNDFWQGKTALFFAVEAGQSAVAKVLIENGAKVNVQQVPSGNTPLILAATAGDLETVKVLVEHKADLNVKDAKGRSAYMVADGPNRSEIQRLLVSAGAEGSVNQAAPAPPVTKTDAPKAAPPVVSKNMTKADWRKAYYARFPAGAIVTVAKFKSAFGVPGRTQTVEQDAYWYYECSDGVIQVVLNDPSVFGSGACVQSVNDF